MVLWFHLHKLSGLGKCVETESRLEVPGSWERGKWESSYLMGTVYFWGDEKFWKNIVFVDGYTTL